MPLKYFVPPSVQEAAQGALALHQESPLAGVWGVAIAEALATGSVDLKTVEKVHGFHSKFWRVVEREVTYGQRTESDSAEVRAWTLCGATAGAVWSAGIVEKAIADGLLTEDVTLELLDLDPQDLYERFSFNAWRYEYGFTPSSAARFVEHYTHATGNLVDLPAAFGDAAPAVGNALYRRVMQPDPFRETRRLLAESEPAYRVAAVRDIGDVVGGCPLTESQEWLNIRNLPPISAAKIVWAPFVAYFILAAEKPELLSAINGASLPPPAPEATALASPTSYSDAINLYLLYFHPKGKHYHDPSTDPKFDGLTEEVYNLLFKAYHGHTVSAIAARKMLGRARRWTAEHKLAGSLFHIFNAAWAKSDWKYIFEHVPPNADVHGVFQVFSEEDPLPKDGVKLQKTVSDKKAVDAVKSYWTNYSTDMNMPTGVSPASHDGTSAAIAAGFNKTPFGVWSEFSADNETLVLVGFFVPDGNKPKDGVFVFRRANGSLMHKSDSMLSAELSDGTTYVTKAHYQKPGTAYDPPSPAAVSKAAAPTPAPAAPMPEPEPEPINTVSIDTEIMDFLKSAYEEAYLDAFTTFDPELTATMTKARSVAPSKAPYGAYTFKAAAFSANLLRAFVVKTSYTDDDGDRVDVDDVVLVFQDPDDKTFISESDDDVVTAITNNKIDVIAPKADAAPVAVGPYKIKPGTMVRLSKKFRDTYALPDVWCYVIAHVGYSVHCLPRYVTPGVSTSVYGVSASDIVEDSAPVSWAAWAGDFSKFFATGGLKLTPQTPPVPPGTTVQLPSGGVTGIVVGAFSINESPTFSGTRVAIVVPDAGPGYPGFYYTPEATFLKNAQLEAASLPPPDSAPKPYLSDDVPWATPEAMKVAYKLGLMVLAYSAREAFVHRAGQGVGIGVVIALATRPSDGVAFYVIQQNSGTIGIKAANPVIVQGDPDEGVISALKPYGNYGCDDTIDYPVKVDVLHAAVQAGVKMTAAPEEPPFFPGTKFVGHEGILVGWASGGAVMLDAKTHSVKVIAASDLKNEVQASVTTALFDEEQGVVFAKGGALSQMYSGPHKFDNSDSGEDHPSLETLDVSPLDFDTGTKRKAAGTIVVVPPGAIIHSAKKSYIYDVPSVVLVYPTGAFANALTFPKGGVDKGEDVRTAAKRETFEETGLLVRLDSHLGDFKRTTSIARMYIASFIGGSPYKAGPETDAVTVRPLNHFYKFKDANVVESATYLSYVNALPWAKPLSAIDRKILAAAVEWLVVNGLPGEGVKHVQGLCVVHPTVGGMVTYFGGSSSPVDGYDYILSPAAVKAFEDGSLNWKNSLAPLAEPFVVKGLPMPGSLVHWKYTKASGSEESVVGVVLGYNEAPARTYIYAGGKVEVLPMANEFKVTVMPKTVSTINPKDSLLETIKNLLVKSAYPIPLASIVNTATSSLKLVAESIADKGSVGLLTLVYQDKFGDHPMSYGTTYKYGTQEYTYLATLQVDNAAECRFVARPDGSVLILGPTTPVLSKVYPDAFEMVMLDPLLVATLSAASAWMQESDMKSSPVTLQQARQALIKAGIPYAASQPWYRVAFLAKMALNTSSLVVVKALAAAAAHEYPSATASATPLAKPKVTTWGVETGTKEVSVTSLVPKMAAVAVTNVDLPWDSDVLQDHMFSFKPSDLIVTSTSLAGGSKPNKVVRSNEGEEFVFKPSVESNGHWRVGAEVAAYQLISALRPGSTPPVRAIVLGGDTGSLQARVMGAKTLDNSEYASLTDAEVGEVLSQHAIDMFLGDHDGGVSNWLRAPDGRLVVIDKGQAFRFITQGVEESLDPGTTPSGVVGKAIGKRLLSDWAASKRNITKLAFMRFAKMILKVQAISDATLNAVLGTWAATVGPEATAAKKNKVLSALKKRRDTYVVEWTKVMVKLAQARGEDWMWPVPMAGAPEETQPAPINAEKDAPEVVLQFTEEQEAVIADARKAGWQGKALQLDAGDVENQEVLVKSVDYASGGKVSEGTLLVFRLKYEVAKAVEAKLDAVAKVVTGSTGPQALPFDAFYNPILQAAKTINHHLSTKNDTDFNQAKIEAFNAVIPTLQEVFDVTKGSTGKYKNVPTATVHAMAESYLDYVKTLQNVLANPQQFVGTKVELFTEFKWEQKPDRSDEDETLADLQVVKSSAFNMPSSSTTANRVVITDVTQSPTGGSGVQQFKISLKSMPGVVLYMAVPGSFSASRSFFGMVWAVFPESPSSTVVARVLRAFEKATDVRMNPAEEEDREYLFLRKQIYISTKGHISVNDKGVQSNPPPAVVKAEALYAQGDKAGAVAAMRPFLAKRLGVPVGNMVKDPRYNAAKFTRNAGYYRTERMDYTEASLKQLLGDNVYIAHSSTGGSMLALFEKVIPHNGALLANAMRPFYGVPMSGVSVPADVQRGGAVGVFMGMRRVPSLCANHLYFDLSLALRDDVLVVGSTDSYGDWTVPRYSDPEHWKEHGLHTKSGHLGATESYQFVARHDVDWQQYLRLAVFSSKKELDAARKLCLAHGISGFAGRPLAQVLVTE